MICERKSLAKSSTNKARFTMLQLSKTSLSQQMASATKVRSIDFLTPDQLRRKREVDRRSQKEQRERTKAHITDLERIVDELSSRNRKLENELTAVRLQCTCSHGKQHLLPFDRSFEEVNSSVDPDSGSSCIAFDIDCPNPEGNDPWGGSSIVMPMSSLIDPNRPDLRMFRRLLLFLPLIVSEKPQHHFGQEY
jgi:hypothetical protein